LLQYPWISQLQSTSLGRRKPRAYEHCWDLDCAVTRTTPQRSDFDTLYDNGFEDGEIAEIAVQQGRIVLTRDRELLKRRIISHGCYVHTLKPSLQLRELYERLDLARSARPFSLCLHCNLPLHEISQELARPQVPPCVGALYSHFLRCDACQRIYWEGSHWRGMCALLAPLPDRKPSASGRLRYPG